MNTHDEARHLETEETDAIEAEALAGVQAAVGPIVDRLEASGACSRCLARSLVSVLIPWFAVLIASSLSNDPRDFAMFIKLFVEEITSERIRQAKEREQQQAKPRRVM
jgi:hypothetical protein